jgi:3-oxoacyl-[acyl-carrier protein] reductase
MKKLGGKVAVVTGASKGIGAGIARTLGEAGAAVVVNYAKDRAGAERVVADIVARDGKAVAVQADVSKAPDIKRLFAEAHAAFGALDILVNNAGVYAFAALEEVRAEEVHRMFDLNVVGLILTTQEAVKHFGAAGGSIINVGSVVSQRAVPQAVVYSATKHAVDGVTRVLAAELGARKIRVNSINPGGVDTEGTHSAGIAGSDFEQQLVAQTPLGRIGQPGDIAKVALFLASADSEWMTGEILVASGGLR